MNAKYTISIMTKVKKDSISSLIHHFAFFPVKLCPLMLCVTILSRQSYIAILNHLFVLVMFFCLSLLIVHSYDDDNTLDSPLTKDILIEWLLISRLFFI